MTGQAGERGEIETWAMADVLYEHREDAMACYDHPHDYCCVCGEHEVHGYRWHLASVLAAHVRAAQERALRDAADVPTPGPSVMCRSPRDRDDQWRAMLRARASRPEPERGEGA